MTDANWMEYAPESGPTFFDCVYEFHEKFNLPIGTEPDFPLTHDEINLRMRLIHEEYLELIEAHNERDIVKVADALGDMIYVICGMAVVYGIPLNRVYAEIQRSNMAKVSPDGTVKYRADGKVLKPDSWTPPDIAGILSER